MKKKLRLTLFIINLKSFVVYSNTLHTNTSDPLEVYFNTAKKYKKWNKNIYKDP